MLRNIIGITELHLAVSGALEHTKVKGLLVLPYAAALLQGGLMTVKLAK